MLKINADVPVSDVRHHYRSDTTDWSDKLEWYIVKRYIVFYKSVSIKECTQTCAEIGRSRHVMNDVMNDNMAASAHFGARLGFQVMADYWSNSR